MELSYQAPAEEHTDLERFGPYVVLERLGVGGMATVHRAKQLGLEGLERLVALKRLLPHLAEDESFVRGFVREAKLASLLQHSNIAQIYELGKIDDVYYIAMELIAGMDVRRVLQHAARAGKPPPVQVAMSILLQLCDALDHAHSATDEKGEHLGIVHRDISPSNLLVTPSGHLKVIDFGIARAQTAQLATQTGRIKGKFGYMPPEVFNGGKVDHRADLFAVGVVAYELLTARPLFTAKNEYQTIINVQQKDPAAPSSVNAMVPSELDPILAKAVAKDQDERWSSGGELADALHEVCRSSGLRTSHREISKWFAESGIASEMERRRWSTVTGSHSSRSSSISQLKRRPAGTLPPDAESRSQSRSELPTPPSDAVQARGSSRASSSPVPSADGTGARPTIDDGQSAAASDAASERAASATDESARAASATGAAQPEGRKRPRTRTGAPPTGNNEVTRAGRPGRPRLRTAPAETSPVQFREVERPATATESAVVARPATAVEGTSLQPVAPQRSGLRRLAMAALAINVGIGALIVWSRLSGPPAVEATMAAVRVDVMPADALVVFDDNQPQQAGKFSLEPGVHSIEIRRDGYRSYVSTLDLPAGGNESMRVVLEEVKDNSARLRIHADSGAELRLDGQPWGAGTNEAIKLEPGKHTVEMWARGKVVWSHELEAEAGTNYELTPAIEAAREQQGQARKTIRRRPTRSAVTRGSADAVTAAPTDKNDAVEKAAEVAKPKAEPVVPPVPDTTSSLVKANVKPPAAPKRSTRRRSNEVVNISESWVNRRAGDVPRLTMDSAQEFLGRRTAAKLCIDTKGNVTSARVLVAKFPQDARDTLEGALLTWKYEPYKDRSSGELRPACFGVSLILAK